MRGCSSIQDNALGYLCRKLKRLEVLDLRETLPDGWSFLAHAQDLRLLQHEYLLNGLSRLFRDGDYDYTDPLPIYKNEHVQYEPEHHPHLITYHLHNVFPYLVKLELFQINIHPQALESIRQMVCLKELTLISDRMTSSEENFSGLMDSCGSSLEVLHLSRFSRFMPLETSAQCCPNLKTLRLEHCRFRTDGDDSSTASFGHQQAPCPQQPFWNQLEHLELTDVPVPMDSKANWILLMPGSLKRCVLCNVNIDDRFLDSLLPSVGMIYLALIGASQLTDKGVENLIVRFRHQHQSQNKLVISDCSCQIRRRHAKLQQLARDNCVQLFLH